MGKCHKGQCTSCPVQPYTEEGMLADAYGCLPHYGDMLKWKDETGKVWACHSNPNKPCSGFTGVMDKQGIKWDLEDGLITEQCTLEEIYADVDEDMP